MQSKKTLVVVALSSAAFVLAACGSGSSNSEDRIVVGTAGGSYLDWEKASALKQAENLYPELDVVYSASSTPDIAAKVLAEKEGGKGSYDVALLPDALAADAYAKGATLKLDFDKIPNAKHQLTDLKTDYGVAMGSSPMSLIYNSKYIKKEPTSYAEVWNPKYKGKVGVMSAYWKEYFYAASAVEAGGYPGVRDWDVPMDKIKALGDIAKVYPSHDELGAAMISGEVWIAVDVQSRAVKWAEEDPDIKHLFPKEGAYRYYWGYSIPKNAKNIDGAYKYLNALLDPKTQYSVAADFGNSPTVDNPGLPDDLAAKFTATPEQAKLIHPIDFEWVAEQTADWEKFWTRNVVQGG